MLRLTAIFVAACAVAIAASLGAVAYLLLGWSATESAIVALAALTALILYNTVSSRARDRGDVGSQIADLSRGTADLARQVAELGRKVAAFENESAGLERRMRSVIAPAMLEIGELGTLVKNLAETVAAHDTRLAALAVPPSPAPAPVPEASATDGAAADPEDPPPAAGIEKKPAAPVGEPSGPYKGKTESEIAALIRAALDAGRIDLYLQPILTLPQRKVRYYEAVARLRGDDDMVILPADFLRHAESAGLLPRIDNLMLFRCVQVLRRLLLKNREIGLFCNISMNTLTDPEFFPQFSQFMEANRALAPSLMLELSQKTWQSMGPLEQESLAALAERGFRFSMDQVTDLRMEPRDLSDRGIRFVKVQASLLLDGSSAPSDIHAGDLSDLLGRFGISLIAERIETEPVVVDLLDCDVRFGQGFLFSAPRPVRAEALQGIAERNDVVVRDVPATADAGSKPRAPSPVHAAGA